MPALLHRTVSPTEPHLDEFNTPVPQSGPTGPIGAAQLGPFHAPERLEVELRSDNSCLLKFLYGSSEPAEDHPRTTSTGWYLLGRHSRKVLEVGFGNAGYRLSSTVVLFDATVANTWVDELPYDKQFVCRRNAQVVEAILRAMPSQVREHLVADLIALIEESKSTSAPHGA